MTYSVRLVPSLARIESSSETFGRPGNSLRLISADQELVFSAHAHEFAKRLAPTMERFIARLRSVIKGEKLERGGTCFEFTSGNCLCLWPDCALFLDAEGNEESTFLRTDFEQRSEKVLPAFISRLCQEFVPTDGEHCSQAEQLARVA